GFDRDIILIILDKDFAYEAELLAIASVVHYAWHCDEPPTRLTREAKEEEAGRHVSCSVD
ncbi:hypothetical protein TorRG33x02_301230, partial [Trema orientale]